MRKSFRLKTFPGITLNDYYIKNYSPEVNVFKKDTDGSGNSLRRSSYAWMDVNLSFNENRIKLKEYEGCLWYFKSSNSVKIS